METSYNTEIRTTEINPVRAVGLGLGGKVLSTILTARKGSSQVERG
jgi:hypothetical protein